MFFIPGWLLAILTFPGVIVHEAAHRFFCDIAMVPVFAVCYFRVGNPSGYVIHAKTASLRANFLISIGPLIVNTLLCAAIGFAPGVARILWPENTPGVFIMLTWLAMSVGMHSFPSEQDMDNFVEAVELASESDLLQTAAGALALLLRVANALRFFWFHAIYAAIVMLVVPLILTRP